MMIGRETWSVAIDALRANKLRAFLTMLGVVIGSACIVLVVTVSLTGRRYILQQIESIGSNIISAQAVHSPGAATALNYEMTLSDMEAIQQGIPNVSLVAGTRIMDMDVVVNGTEYTVSLIGVTQSYEEIRHLVILRGRYFDDDDMAARNKVCLITDNLAKRVFGAQNPIGLPIRLGELTFTVVGVFRERVSTYGLSEIQSDSVLIPFSLMKYYTGDDYLRGLYVQMATPDDVAKPQRHFECCQADFLRPHDRPPGYRVDRLDCQRHRHHEYHARHCDGADTRDRRSPGHRGTPHGDSLPVPARIFSDQRRGGGFGSACRRQHPGTGAAIATGEPARARPLDRGRRRAGRILSNRRILWIFAGEQGSRFAAYRISTV